MALIELQSITKQYRMGPVTVDALRDVSVSFEQGTFAAIMGASGSGKSTMLNLLGCLDRPTSGRYMLGGRDVAYLSDDERSEIRSREIGFVFQSYNLIQQLTVLENIEVPLFYQGWTPADSRPRAEALAEMVGLGQRLHHRPTELSGGQQQRVAIARALVSDPLMLLGDEPTGNLDSATGQEILDLLARLNAEGKAILVVTHDERTAGYARERIVLRDGRIMERR